MTTQLNPEVYADCIQYQLTRTVNPSYPTITTPVYANFNRNWATQDLFLTWQLRNVHQPVYTGQTQSNKGIDRPTFQVSIFGKSMADTFQTSYTILQLLHGYSGEFGNTATNAFWVAKVDVYWLYNTYDNEIGLNQVVLDCILDIPA